MTLSETTRMATVESGHLVLTEELRDQIRERLLGMLDTTTRRLERQKTGGGEFATRGELEEELETVRAALVKLDAGYYGVCEGCEGPISIERLDAVPGARRCVPCQSQPRRMFG